MLRAIYICVFLSIYILIAGPPLLLYTVLTKNVAPLYWAGVNGVMFFVRCVGVRVPVNGLYQFPADPSISAPTPPSPAAPPAVVWAIPRRIAILLKRSLFDWP